MSIDKKIMEQLEKDRERTEDLYNDIKNKLLTTQDYVMLGDVAVKISDLMSKQTNQLIEMYKIEQKNKKPENEGIHFSKEESEEIQDFLEENSKSLVSLKV